MSILGKECGQNDEKYPERMIAESKTVMVWLSRKIGRGCLTYCKLKVVVRDNIIVDKTPR